ncbi:hypothetical protein CVT26_015923 [Gymnopilus dilepis]|uniref:Uncharacterized protein n=1 Tax=Gymnopilus dilepis TaxID=231916 RepID=A0A409XYG8_9AGAR|nr:hypothetical protein CVT26_015923 [Gymnopilus dilepis]
MGKSPSNDYTSPRSGSVTLWEETLKNLDQQVEVYRSTTAQDAQHDVSQATESVPVSMPEAMSSLPSPAAKAKWQKKQQKMKYPGDKESAGENPFKQMGRGFLTILTTPVALVGAGLYGVGLMVEGTAVMLKGMGSLGLRVFVPPRKRDST